MICPGDTGNNLMNVWIVLLALQIHGREDQVLPWRKTQTDQISRFCKNTEGIIMFFNESLQVEYSREVGRVVRDVSCIDQRRRDGENR